MRVAVGLLLLAVGALAAVDGRVGAAEQAVFREVNRLPAAAGTVLLVVMQLGSILWLPVVAAVALLARRRALAGHLLGAGGLTWLVVNLVLKPVTARVRPDQLLTEVIIRGDASGLGFPSGHTALTTALATVVTLASPARWLTWLAWLVVAATGLGRIYAGVHLPADVLGGAGAGLVIASTWYEVIRRRVTPRP